MNLLSTHFSASSNTLTAIAEHDGKYSVFQTQGADVLGTRLCSCKKQAEGVFLRWITGCSILAVIYAQGMAPRLGFAPLALLRAASDHRAAQLEDVQHLVVDLQNRSQP